MAPNTYPAPCVSQTFNGEPTLSALVPKIKRIRVLVGWVHQDDTPNGLMDGQIWGWCSADGGKFQVYDTSSNRSDAPGKHVKCGPANFTMVRMFVKYWCDEYGNVPKDMVSLDKQRCRQKYWDLLEVDEHVVGALPDAENGDDGNDDDQDGSLADGESAPEDGSDTRNIQGVLNGDYSDKISDGLFVLQDEEAARLSWEHEINNLDDGQDFVPPSEYDEVVTDNENNANHMNPKKDSSVTRENVDINHAIEIKDEDDEDDNLVLQYARQANHSNSITPNDLENPNTGSTGSREGSYSPLGSDGMRGWTLEDPIVL